MRTNAAPVIPDSLPTATTGALSAVPTVSPAGAARLSPTRPPQPGVGQPHRVRVSAHPLDTNLFGFLGAEFAGRRPSSDVSLVRWSAAAVGVFVLPLFVVAMLGGTAAAAAWGIVSGLLDLLRG